MWLQWEPELRRQEANRDLRRLRASTGTLILTSIPTLGLTVWKYWRVKQYWTILDSVADVPLTRTHKGDSVSMRRAFVFVSICLGIAGLGATRAVYITSACLYSHVLLRSASSDINQGSRSSSTMISCWSQRSGGLCSKTALLKRADSTALLGISVGHGLLGVFEYFWLYTLCLTYNTLINSLF